jgi:hypothetical protein
VFPSSRRGVSAKSVREWCEEELHKKSVGKEEDMVCATHYAVGHATNRSHAKRLER